MSQPQSTTSAFQLFIAWMIVTIPLAWGVYRTVLNALALFQ